MPPLYSVAELLVRHSETRGQQIAFSAPGREVSYADLAARTGRIAGHLAGAGIARGDRVAIVLGSRIEAVESILAITRAAAIGVPLDPRSSEAELADALSGSGARVVITDGQRLGRVRAVAGAGTVIAVVAPDVPDGCLPYEDLAERDSPRPACDDLGLDEPAWLHYTSGTTGDRKGVLSCQRAWLWSAGASYGPALKMTSADRLLWPLPLFHAYGHSLCVIGTVARVVAAGGAHRGHTRQPSGTAPRTRADHRRRDPLVGEIRHGIIGRSALRLTTRTPGPRAGSAPPWRTAEPRT
jgi:acyl-CoA synthetase (AMP-forming)/AMP-acid ligase II